MTQTATPAHVFGTKCVTSAAEKQTQSLIKFGPSVFLLLSEISEISIGRQKASITDKMLRQVVNKSTVQPVYLNHII